jgi:uncharacterized protein YkwD
MVTVVLAALLLAGPQAQTLELVNAARDLHGAPALRPDPRLARAARRHSRDMVARRYFDHVSPGGADLRDRVARTGWIRGRARWRLAENLGWGSGSLATPDAIVDAWLESPAHRRILLDRGLRVVGIGIARGTPQGAPGATFTADFGAAAHLQPGRSQ